MVEVTQADRDAAASVILTREIFDFLMGIGPLEGVEFGELHDGLPGRFWWRAVLRAAERETPAHRLAAIAAVLDDMAEPSDAVTEAGALVRARGYATDDIWQAMLAQYRKERGDA